ncbi:MAG TPA: MarC family protein [Terriglobales bacterium]|nr:MarC family protein [Terriglobales bacterium]
MEIVASVTRSILVVVAALFPIVNPLGSALLFLSLTRAFPSSLRRTLVLKVSIYSFILLIVSILIGSHVLHFFGVSIPVVQVAGGIVVSATGWKLLLQPDSDMKSKAVDPSVALQEAFYPLTLPITVGPGSISVAITLGADTARTIYLELPRLIAALVGSFIVALSVYICYRSADKLEKILGPTGLGIFLRLSAFIVICIGVQILWNGVAALIHGL